MISPQYKAMNDLVESGAIAGYELLDLTEDGKEGRDPKGRNIQRLVIRFKTGEMLSLETFCSGCAENSGFQIESSRGKKFEELHCL